MLKAAILLSLSAAVAAGCDRPAAAVLNSPTPEMVSAPHATGPRWVVIKAEGLDCTSCAAALAEDLRQVAGLSQIETFAPQPYCRFFVEDGGLDVPRLLDGQKVEHSAALEGYKFIRGG